MRFQHEKFERVSGHMLETYRVGCVNDYSVLEAIQGKHLTSATKIEMIEMPIRLAFDSC
jgi:hypothetical protein